jgi:hypothetical protein
MALPIFQMMAIPRSNNEEVEKERERKGEESTDQNVDKSKRGEERETQPRARQGRISAKRTERTGNKEWNPNRGGE